MHMETAIRQTLSPMLGLHDAKGAIEFYKKAFGAAMVGEPVPYEGKIGHAELQVGGAVIMLADEYPEHNSTPKTLGGTPVILHLNVDDCDAWVNRAIVAEAQKIYEPMDQPYGRVCKIKDHFDHIWMLNGPNKSA